MQLEEQAALSQALKTVAHTSAGKPGILRDSRLRKPRHDSRILDRTPSGWPMACKLSIHTKP